MVLFEELPEELRQDPELLDFGLWDRVKACSQFLLKSGLWNRWINIDFALAHENCKVKARAELFAQMLTHVWLVDDKYADAQKDLTEPLRSTSKEYNKHLRHRLQDKISPDGDFYLRVSNEQQIRSKVLDLLAMWKLTRKDQDTASMATT